MQAGCKRKEWYGLATRNNQGKKGVFRWVGNGKLLTKGACIEPGYTQHVVPEKGTTTIYSTIEKEKVRSVSADDATLSVDFTLTMTWLDPNIKVNVSEEDRKTGKIVLSKEVVNVRLYFEQLCVRRTR